MKILLICSRNFKSGQTGDATQGRETARALISSGVELRQLFVQHIPVRVFDKADNELSEALICDALEWCDAIHLLPVSQPLIRFWCMRTRKPILGSSIFWGGIERAVIAFNTNQKLYWKIRSVAREIRNMLPMFMDFRGVNVFLPNSDAEGKRVMKCFKTSKGTTYRVVPNGFIPPEIDVWKLPKSSMIPFDGEYIVVPGVFAKRKNQLGLIRALKKSKMNYNVVFLGGVFHPEYYEKCRDEASDNMFFAGYLPSNSAEYWQILRHARASCLTSDCETPGIAMMESAYAGARPVITKYGGTEEYYGEMGEYLNPCFSHSIISAVERGWERGRLSRLEAMSFAKFSWKLVADRTIESYAYAIEKYGKNKQ